MDRLRLYAVEDGRLRKLTQAAAPGGKQPYFARFSPDGRHIAVGFHDTTAVNVLDAATLALAFAPDTRGVDNGNLGNVAWSADGQYLYAAGRWDMTGDRFSVRRWAAGGRGAFTDIPVAGNTVMDLAALPDDGLIFGARDPLGRGLGTRGRYCAARTPPSRISGITGKASASPPTAGRCASATSNGASRRRCSTSPRPAWGQTGPGSPPRSPAHRGSRSRTGKDKTNAHPQRASR